MEQKDKFQKKFSEFRHAVASKSPLNKSKSNSILKGSSLTKKTKPKDVQKQKMKGEKKNSSNVQKLRTIMDPISSSSLIHDLQLQLSTLNSTLKHLPISSIGQITNYYQIIKEFIKQMISSPLYNILKLLHSIYTIPLPTLISKNQFNTKIYTQQSDQSSKDLINKSKSIILQNYLQPLNNSSKFLTSTTNESRIEIDQNPNVSKKDINTNSSKKLGLKLNMQRIQETKQNVKDYFDEFYDNIEEFSESWRQQAIKQKR